MRTRTRNPFTTVTTAGLLLPVDLLTRVIEGDPDLKGLSPKDYHLRSGERLNEAASRAWNECLAGWKSFRKKFNALPALDAGTTVTRDEWLLPLFQELGYGRLQSKKAIEIEGKEYPISHGWENHVPIHLLSARLPLDRRTPGISGAATRAPYSLLQELLNRSAQHRWGFVTNGLKLFLLRDNAALARAANVEFDLEAMLDGEHYADFMLMFLLCHQSRLEIALDGKPDDCWLEKWANQADQQGTRAREKLRDGVETAIKSLGAGFLTTKGNNALRDRLRTGELSTQDYYRQLLRVVYRLLMLLVAEEKKTENGENLLHPTDTTPEVRDRYARFYSVSRIRSLAYERRGTAHTDLYESLKVLFLKLREGYAPLGIPGMGSFLFSNDSTPDLDDALLANQDLLDAFRNLCYTEDTSGRGGSYRRPVDFGNLGSEELGSVYESLLELHPNIDTDEGPFTLGTAAGNERKTTGSYYTPTSLINCLLDSALDPVVSEAIREAERMGNSEWRMVEAKYKEEFARYAYRRLPGFTGLATWKEDRQSSLSADTKVPKRGTLRDDIPDASSSNVDSGEHRRGMGTALPGGVHPVSTDSQRQPDRVGDASDNQHRRGAVQRSGRTANSGGVDDTGKTTAEPGTKPQEADEWRLANSEWDTKLEMVWTKTPLTIRHSLLAEPALLALKVCDPACGSGHFLIAASERMAMHLARIRTGDDQPNTLDVQHAKRDIIGRCIYGVDINPMAVELCKVSLWMEALEPGKPLSFLDHHIQCGNSLLGTTPRLLAEGIPDDAFKPIEGDDKKVCSELKKSNKKERQDYKAGQGYLFEPLFKLGNAAAEFAKLTAAEDDSLDSIAMKRQRYHDLVKGADYLNARFWADTWCATFVWKKDESDLGRLCPTERKFRDIERSPHNVLPHVRDEIVGLASSFQFFHWHIAYPDVFFPFQQNGNSDHTNEQIGGFSVVLGNPPWEHTELKDKEWFAARKPELVSAKNAAQRKKMIKQLCDDDPELFAEFMAAKRSHTAVSDFVRHSGRYPLCGVGRVNTYAIFAETNYSIIDALGRAGFIVQSDIATGDTYKDFFSTILRKRQLVSFFDFVNTEGLFPNVHRTHPHFCLITLSGSDCERTTDFAFWNTNTGHLAEPERHFSLSFDQLSLLNPNTKTCPIFRSQRDAELALAIASRVPVLVNEGVSGDKEWTAEIGRMFNASDDAGAFETGSVEGSDVLKLYESKSFWQFDHRYSTYCGTEYESVDISQKAAAKFSIQTLYQIRRKNVPAKFVEKLRPWYFVYRIITNSTNERTLVGCIIPECGVLNSANLVTLPNPLDSIYLLANFNTFAADYCCRLAMGGANLHRYVLQQIPMIEKQEYDRAFRVLVERCVMELMLTSTDLSSFAVDYGYDGPPFRWDEERRFQIRCELDAAYFHLYLGSDEEWGREKREGNSDVASREDVEQNSSTSLSPHSRPPSKITNPQLLEMFPTPRDAVSYIMDTFPIVRRKDEAKYDGDYRTKRTILEIYDAMAEVMRANREVRMANRGKTDEELHSQFATYHSPLNPPPGPPTDAEGNFIPFAQWTPDLNTTHIHPPRDAEVSTSRPLVVDPVFPGTELDKVLCACLLDFAQAESALSEDQNLDKVILAMQTKRCRSFLTGDDTSRYEESLANVPAVLIEDADGKPPWRLLLSSLLANRSLVMIEDRIALGENFDAVRPNLPKVDRQFLSLVAKAAERYREFSEADETDESTRSVVQEVQQQHAAVQAGARG